MNRVISKNVVLCSHKIATMEQHNSTHVGEALASLVQVLKELREKCPWDRVQTNQSLRRFTIEELYEFIDAIDKDNPQEIKEELGDLLTHIIFYSNIAEEKKQFTLTEVLDANREKLISRHPHVYGQNDLVLNDDRAVEKNWEKLKGKEKKSMFSGLPTGLPSVTKAQKLQDKASRFGFEWEHTQQAYQQVEKEVAKMHQAIGASDRSKMEAEMGDVLFAWINFIRMHGIDPDLALERSNHTFKTRIEWMEQDLASEQKTFHDCDLAALKLRWKESRKHSL